MTTGGGDGGGTGDGGVTRTPLTPEEKTLKLKEQARINESLKEQLKIINELRSELEKLTKGTAEYLDKSRELEAAELSKLKIDLRVVEVLQELYGETEEYTAKIADLTQKIKDQKDKLEELGETLRNFNSSMAMGTQAGNQLATSIGITSSRLSEFFESLQKGKFNLDGFKEGLKDSFTGAKIGTSAINTYIDSNIELFATLQTVNSELNKSFTPEYANRIINSTNSIEVSLRRYNIGFDESAKAVETLNNNMSDFANLTDNQIETLATDSALMTKFGISNEDYASSIQEMTKGFGDSIEAAQENMREMRSFSGAIGKSTKEVMADFGKVQSFLAQYGSNYENIFRRMEVITRKTGVAIQDLQSVAEGFDQFDGASQSVGKLNALLGGPFLNTIDMINTEDPAEQIMKIKLAFDAAGRSVNSMTRRELQAFASSIPGINGDINKMKMLFGQLDQGVLDSADSINSFIEGSDDSTEMLKTQAELTMTLKDTFDAIKKMIAENGPLIQSLMTTLQSGLQGIATLGENIRNVMFDLGKIFSKVLDFPLKIAGELTELFGPKFLSKIPGLGILIGVISGLSRLASGDLIGAAGELASGIAGGFGLTALSVGIDAALLGSDIAGYTGAGGSLNIGGRKETEMAVAGYTGASGSLNIGGRKETEMAVGGIVTREVNNVTIGERGREAVIPLEDGKDYLVDPLAKAVQQVGGGGFGGTPNINLTVMLEGRELRAFVKNVIVENLNPLK